MKRALSPLLLLLALASFSVCGFAAPAAETDAAALDRYLAAGAPLPVWTQAPGIEAALAAEAASHGLNLSLPMAEEETPAQRRMLAALRLARALAQGAVRPDTVQPDWTIPVPAFDPEAALHHLGASGDPLPWLRSLAPQQEDYQRLRQALALYRGFARGGGWPMLPNGPLLKPGAADPRVPLLRSRLMLEGDLAANAATGTVFDATTEQALRRFQRRHGLAADGRLGSATLAALNVSAEDRARQIAPNLERWRWLPRALPDDRIVVNAAAAGLSLVKSGEPALRLRVIVGTPQHPTPVLAARIVSLLLNPPWDIPSSIAAKEIRPRARRDPEYLAREGIVAHGGGLRQLPGPKNALGALKFEMPNPLDVYLHDTPDKRLFERVPRFFSHGCIRLEHPQELAVLLLLQDAAASARLEPAIAAGKTSRLPVTPTIPIYVLYFTAAAHADGTVMLYDDLYGRDAPLIAALFPDAPPIDARP
jgi:L,D-transpeptidase YcbB